MTIRIKDLITLREAASSLERSVNDLLLDSIEGDLQLFSIAKRDRSLGLIPCTTKIIEEKGFYIDCYTQDDIVYIEISIGQPIALNQKACKSLLVNGNFQEVELYRSLTPDVEGVEHWKSRYELSIRPEPFEGDPEQVNLDLASVYVSRSQISSQPRTAPSGNSSKENSASNTSLKVIGLLMHHLAKSQRYASGDSPNKSQIKELLLDLANEFEVNPYGLSKVDERLLNEAMKYLESQKS